MKFAIQIFDFFLPRFCPSCATKLNEKENFVCTKCLSNIKKASEELLRTEYLRKFSSDNIISGFYSLFVFEKDKEFQQIVHEIKYKGNFRLSFHVGQLIAEELKEILQSWSPDLLIPIPLHHLKKAERGYNQAYYLAKGISRELGIPVCTSCIKRKRFTPSQTKLNLQERKSNIEGAFKLKNGKKLVGKNIIIVDDVITTGATISECGKILLDAGAAKVFALSAAIAEL